MPTVARPPTTRALVVYLVPNHVNNGVLPRLIKEEVMARVEVKGAEGHELDKFVVANLAMS